LIFYSCGKITAQTLNKQFSGSIKAVKEDLNLELRIHQQGDSLFGSYYYTAVGTDMLLKGTLINTKIHLKEYNSKEVHTGSFYGTYYEKGDSIKGTWSNPKNTIKLPFAIYAEDPTNYKIVYRKKKDSNTEMEWFEMRENPDSGIQAAFNNLEPITPRSFNGMEEYYVADKDTIFYSMTTWMSLGIKTNEFICFSRFISDYWGGAGAENNIAYYLYDLREKEMLGLNAILRSDTNSFAILEKWVNDVIKKRGEWDQWKSDYLINFKKDETFLGEFYLSSDGVYFYFPAYGASTNILWIDDVKISYKNFVRLLQKESIVYKWIIAAGKV
jgi:hypothetical protein